MAGKGALGGHSLLCFISEAWLVAGRKDAVQMCLCASVSSKGKPETLEATQSEFIVLDSKALSLQGK